MIRHSSMALILLICLLPLLAAADESPRLRVVRVDEGPEIDGQLDDPVWERATVIDRLIQAEPQQGAPISERTEIRVLSDLDNLYFGIRNYDRHPELIIAQTMLRDADLWSEDRIGIALDTFHDRRNGYLFEVNALGAKLDALIENGEFDSNWDGIWYAKARIDDEGWVLEIAIPYKTVSFAPDGDTWGMNIVRVIRRREERARWAKLGFKDEDFLGTVGSTAFGEEGYATLERRWARPSCDVNGLYGGYMGEGAKTVIPSFAGAKVSFRIPAAMDPVKTAEQFTDWIESQDVGGCTWKIEQHGQAYPVAVSIDSPYIAAAGRAIEQAKGRPPVLVRDGATIPIIADFKQRLGLDTLLIGFGLNEDGIHSPNECFGLDRFALGCKTHALLLEQVAGSTTEQ